MMSDEVKMKPAICTQCGGTLEVDPTKETAECPYCGASFIVEKAVNNYNVKYANIGHADNVNIDVSGVFDMIGKQMSESREMRREERKEERARRAENEKLFFKTFFKAAIVFFALAFIIFIIMHVFNLWGDDEGSGTQPGYEQTEQAGEADDEFEFDNESIFKDEDE